MQIPRQQFRASSPAVTGPRTEAVLPHITSQLETHTLTSCTMFCT